MKHVVTLIPGDGIGPEVTGATLKVIEATGVDIEWDVQDAGVSAIDSGKEPLPDALLQSVRRTGVALKGPLTTPVGTGFRSVNVLLRQKLDLFANVRPSRSLPGIRTPFKDVDLVLFRENTEGLYSGIETYDERLEIADATARVTKAGSERIIRFCFEYAKKRDRKRVTLVHKANILKITSGLFLEVGREIASEYPEIEFEDRIVDNMCMQLVMYPERYDCIVTTNLFGDILSDLAAGLVGGLGMVAGANIGDEYAVFEAVHGSAPDIAGKDLANPTALLQSAELMLDHLGEVNAAGAVRAAIRGVFSEARYLTRDVGGKASTTDFAEHVADKVAAHVEQAV
jgi:isocitrate dehydrogenase (NAD+)